MDKELARDITESIKSGEYFTDARDWYSRKYIHLISQRSFLIVITVISVLMAVVAIRVLMMFLPLVQVVPIAIEIESKVTEQPKLVPLGQKSYISNNFKDSNEPLIKYLVVRYIEARENYDYDSLVAGDKLKYLKDFSSREVFDKYKQSIAIDNPESPIIRYKKYSRRVIEPLDATLIQVGKKIESGVQKVAVRFRSIEVGPQGVKKSLWIAKVEAEYTVVTYSKEIKKFSPLDFKVIHYEVSKIGDE